MTTGARTPYENLSSEDSALDEGQISELDDSNEGSDEESDTSDENCSELGEKLLEIQDTIAHLYRLSFKMRNASHRSLSTKPLSIKPVDPDTGEDLFSQYATFDYQYVLESLCQLRQTPQSPRADLGPVQNANDDISSFLVH